MDDGGVTATIPQPPAERGRRLPIPLIGLLLVLVVGTTAALAAPVISVAPSKPTAQLLPASTVLYLSADLNPAGAARADLNAIRNDFTGQPGWSGVLQQFNSASRRQPYADQCYRQTQRQVSSHLGELGHDSALALIGTAGLTGGQAEVGLQRNLVLLVSLDVRMSLLQALAGFHLSLPQQTSSYRGTTIYQEFFPSCGKVRQGTPDSVYVALYQGYVVLALAPQPIERVIDTGAGRIASLATVPSYRRLLTHLPAQRLGLYYMDSAALQKLSPSSLSPLTVSLSSSPHTALQPSAGALSVGTQGFRFLAVTEATGPATLPAGRLAADLPANTLAFLSIQDLGAIVRTVERQMKQSGLLTPTTARSVDPILHDFTADLSGETDLAVLRPAVQAAGAITTDPAALLWQVANPADARSRLDDLARRLGLGAALHDAVARDGTVYRVDSAGYGVAVRGNWAIASLALARTLNVLAAPGASLAATTAYHSAIPPGSTPTSVWYIDLRGLRTTLEVAMLPSLAPVMRTQYDHTVRPLIAPLRSIAGSAGRIDAAHLGVSTVVVDIGPGGTPR